MPLTMPQQLPVSAHLPHKRRPLPLRRRPACPTVPRAAMYVPSDSFGGLSPEAKAASMLRTMFTFVAVKVIMAQMEGSGRGAVGSYGGTQYHTLQDLLVKHPMRDGDEWIERLLEVDPALALRVMEVRASYADVEDDQGFEWHMLPKLTGKGMTSANTKLLQRHANHALMRSLQAAKEGDGADSTPFFS